MPRFDYVALTSLGEEVKGEVEAADIDAARQTLRSRALLPMQVELEGAGSVVLSKITSILRQPTRFLPVSDRDKQFMFRQLALMVRSGHRLRNALETIEGLSIRYGLANAIHRMTERLDSGETFASALRQEGKMFPRYVWALIEVGERSGTLDNILDEVATSMERSRVLRNSVLRALIMPTITLIVAFLVMGFIMFWLVPILTTFLVQYDNDVHWTMQMLISVSDFLEYRGRMIAAVLGVTTFALLIAYTTKRGKEVLDRVMLSTPIFGRTAILFEMSRFGNIGMLLIRAGLRQVESLRLLASVTQNTAYQTGYFRASEHLLEGQKLAAALDTPIFDKLAIHMVRVGESSGDLDAVLGHVGTYYADELETRIRVLFGTLVPAFTIIIGLIVGIIYISVILTVLGAYNSIR